MSNWDSRPYFPYGTEVVTWVTTKVSVEGRDELKTVPQKPRLERKKIKSSTAKNYDFDTPIWKQEKSQACSLEEIHRLNLPIGSKVTYQGRYYEVASLEVYPHYVSYDLINAARTQTLPGIHHDQLDDLIVWGKPEGGPSTTKGRKIGKVVI